MLEILRDIVNMSMEGPTPYIVLVVVVFFVFVEQWVLFSLLSPGSWGIIVASFMAFSGTVPVELMVVSIFIAAFAGSHLQFLIGKTHGDRFLEWIDRFPFPIDTQRIRETRVNVSILIMSYSLPQIRGIMPFLAGTSAMPWWHWYPASIVGIVIWLAIFILMGMGAAEAFDGDLNQALDWVWEVNTSGYLAAFFWVTTLLICIYYIQKWRHRRLN